MTDQLREALERAADDLRNLRAPRKSYATADRAHISTLMSQAQEAEARIRAALAAAPQPAQSDRKALVEVILDALVNGRAWTSDFSQAETIADALLARGLTLPGGETMAWAVIGEDGKPNPRRVYADARDLAVYISSFETRNVRRVAIRVVEGGDDA